VVLPPDDAHDNGLETPWALDYFSLAARQHMSESEVPNCRVPAEHAERAGTRLGCRVSIRRP